MKITTKNCSKHGELNETNAKLNKDHSVKDGWRWRCTQCSIETNAKWRANNLEKHRQTAREYQKKHTKEINAKIREDRKNNPEKYREYEKQKRANNRERYRENGALQAINNELKGLCRTHGLPKNAENNYTCQKCRNIYQKKKYNENLEISRKKVREKRSRNLDRYNENSTIRQYVGLTREKYQQMFIDQDNKCAICNEHETRINRSGGLAKLAVDHCHTTLKIRGLLCHDCNTAIGKMQDNIQLLQNAIEYLKKHDA